MESIEPQLIESFVEQVSIDKTYLEKWLKFWDVLENFQREFAALL